MVRDLANRAMTTMAQKACAVIDHLVEALGSDSSSSLRRAQILIDIDQHPGSTQSAIMERLDINKSTMNREIEWLFNYGCIMFQENTTDGRSKEIYICGYSKRGLDAALEYCEGSHEKLKFFLINTVKTLKQEKPTLRDAKIVASLFERGAAEKQDIMGTMYDGGTSTDYRALNKLVETGIITEDA